MICQFAEFIEKKVTYFANQKFSNKYINFQVILSSVWPQYHKYGILQRKRAIQLFEYLNFTIIFIQTNLYHILFWCRRILNLQVRAYSCTQNNNYSTCYYDLSYHNTKPTCVIYVIFSPDRASLKECIL